MTEAISHAVIGAGYGDEGKGRTVDWLAGRLGPTTVVVRSNGGAQAGHTVAVRDGARHIFHHVGSGAFRGAATHLSQFMVSLPMMLRPEMDRIACLGGCTRISADPRGLVTTPWDMMVNQALEIARADVRHGSCGLGFGETVARNEETEFSLCVGILGSPRLEQRLRAIRDEWLPWRLKQLQIDPSVPGPLEQRLAQGLWANFLGDCEAFVARVGLRHDASLGADGPVIFEAAQGLRLDQHHCDFPFLTRSNTGIRNMGTIAREAEISSVAPVYVSRCYLTRHGRGPMSDERDISARYSVDDPTNCPNPWQETLRFGLLDPAALAADISADLPLAGTDIRLAPSIAVTCLDQIVEGKAEWLEGGRVTEGSREALVEAIRHATGLDVVTFLAP